MIFASKAFFIFLPTVLVIYHLLRRRSHKYSVLLAASWLFFWAVNHGQFYEVETPGLLPLDDTFRHDEPPP